MLAWRVAAIIFLFRWIFRDPKVDMRFLASGAVLPDVIDLMVVTVMGGTSGELWAHSLLAPTIVAVAVLATTRRGRRRRAWMALVVAWLFHILLDGMWTDATVFLWPAFGWRLDVGGAAFWPGAWSRALSDPLRWVWEAAGVGYLVWLWVKSGLSMAANRATLLGSGRLSA
jgi:hypothetical protein